MNVADELCNGCGATTRNLNSFTRKRKHTPSRVTRITGVRNPYGSAGDPTKGGRYGDVWVGGGLCDKCADGVEEYIRTMIDFLARR